MVRPQRKPKAGYQKPKKRKKIGSGGGSAAGSSGTMSGLRNMFKKTANAVAGTDADKKPTTAGRVIDILLWIAVAGAVAYFIFNAQCAR